MASWSGFFVGLGKVLGKILSNDQAITVMLELAKAKSQKKRA